MIRGGAMPKDPTRSLRVKRQVREVNVSLQFSKLKPVGQASCRISFGVNFGSSRRNASLSFARHAKLA